MSSSKIRTWCTQSRAASRVGSVVVGDDGSRNTLQASDAGIAVDGDDEDIPERGRFLQVADVSDVQQVEAAVGEDYFFSLTTKFTRQLVYLINRHQFGVGQQPGCSAAAGLLWGDVGGWGEFGGDLGALHGGDAEAFDF